MVALGFYLRALELEVPQVKAIVSAIIWPVHLGWELASVVFKGVGSG